MRYSAESARGCGYRSVGGLYLVGGGLSAPCGRALIPLTVCPTCHGGIKPTRGWTWIEPRALFQDPKAPLRCDASYCALCPFGGSVPERAGLIWIGESHYATPAAFNAEADRVGVSRRVPAVPKGLDLSDPPWVYLAHRKAIRKACAVCRGEGAVIVGHAKQPCEPCGGAGATFTAAIFWAFRPSAIEKIVAYGKNGAPLTAVDPEEIARLEARGITPVIVEKLSEGTEPLPLQGAAPAVPEGPALH